MCGPHTQAQASRAPCTQGSSRSHSSYDGWPATTACRRCPRSAALHRAALCGVARCSDGPQVRVVRRRQVLLHTHQRGASWGAGSSAVLVGDFGGRCSSRLTPPDCSNSTVTHPTTTPACRGSSLRRTRRRHVQRAAGDASARPGRTLEPRRCCARSVCLAVPHPGLLCFVYLGWKNLEAVSHQLEAGAQHCKFVGPGVPSSPSCAALPRSRRLFRCSTLRSSRTAAGCPCLR
jgi:hypothetical protein